VTRDNRRSRHDVPTGRPPGAPKGSANACRTGVHSSAAVANRKTVNRLLREARKLIREAGRGE
jgi:hypothetical protein